MKKLIFTLALSMIFVGIYAQADPRSIGTTTKSGQVILPEKGDFAIGIDATSFLKYIGNSFNGNVDNNNIKIFDYKGGIFEAPAIYGKYFFSESSALRVKLNLGFDNQKTKEPVEDINADGEFVDDEISVSSNSFGITAGYEWRRGYGRLQGYAGPELGLGFGSQSISYDYGNPINKNNPQTTPRKTSEKEGSVFAFKVGGFVGVEYFIAPKLSIGGEASLGLATYSNGKNSIETERWNDEDSRIDRDKVEGGSSSHFEMKAAYSGVLNITFHF